MYLFLILIFLLVLYLGKHMRKPPNFPPGPLWLPFVGSTSALKKASKALGGQQNAFAALAEKYRTNVLGLKLGSENVIVVLSYPLVREVLVNEEYDGRPDNFFIKLRCMGKRRGITATDGEIWNSQRNFANRHLRGLGFGKKTMDEMVRHEAEELVSLLDADGSNVCVDIFLAPSVINVLWRLVSGDRINREDSRLTEFLNLFKMRSRAFDMTGGILTQFPWLRHIIPEYIGYNLIKKVNSKLKDFFMEMIQSHKKTWEEGKNDDLIYRYISEMNMNTPDSKYFNESELVILCLDLFLAGAQTTSGTLEFAFFLMIMYPEIQKKVQQEIDEKLDKNYPIEYADRLKVPYVQAVLFEVMRHRHVLPIIGPRRVLKDTTLDGYFIPKDTTVLISLHSVHEDPLYWENSKTFMPERFLDKNGSLVSDDRLIPFGLGHRRCLGEVLAKNCIFVFFVEILRKFNVSIAPGSKPLTDAILPGITVSPQSFTARFTKRSLKSDKKL